MSQGGGTGGGGRRSKVPRAMQDAVFVECGHSCSIPWCPRQDELDVHHINVDPDDNRLANLLVLCNVHHALAHTRGSGLNREACEQLKATVTLLSIPKIVDRAALERKWRRLRSRRNNRARREELFESFVGDLLGSTPGMWIVERRAMRPTGEVDILVRNKSTDPLFRKLGDYVVVGCEVHRRKHVQGRDVADFLARMVANRWKAGLLFSLSGFAPEAIAVADSVSGKDLLVALVGPEEISAMIEADDRADTIKQVIRRYRGDR